MNSIQNVGEPGQRVNDLVVALSGLPVTDGVADALVGDLEIRISSALVQAGQLDLAEEWLSRSMARNVAVERQAAADVWLQLARAWQRSGKSGRAEASLRQALACGSSAARRVLAQHLQREKRFAEAVTEWREAVRLAPHDSSVRLALARAFEQMGQSAAALDNYLEVVEAAPSLATYLIVAERLQELEARLPEAGPGRLVRIALLGNSTLDHLRSYLLVECWRAGLRPSITLGGFDQYTQEILNPQSALYASKPEVVVCAIHASRLFPRLHDYPFDLTVDERHAEIEAGLHALTQLLDAFVEHSSAMLLLHNMVLPQYPALGILDARDDLGQAAAFADINLRLAELVRTRYRNVYIVDEDRIQSQTGKSTATDARLWLTARMAWSEPVLANLSREYLRYIRAAKGLSRKCIVVDLDNTLWGGVVGEDGVAGIQLGPDAPGNAFVAVQSELLKLWRRGILLAVCSKNNLDDVLPVFETHPEMRLKLSHFAAQRINWQPKATNIREIARELNIGLDSLVFLDDNPVERVAVRAELPEVLVPELPVDPAEYRGRLLELAGVFDTLALTAEDRERNRLYVEQRARLNAQAEVRHGGSIQDYLANLEIVVEIEPDSEVSLPRIAQLTGKTNQFNLTTHRYTEAEIVEMKMHGWRVFSARVRDRFGDNGLTGVVIAGPTSPGLWSIDTLLLSCRVMGRGVETALLAHVASEARRAGALGIEGWYLPTAKNDVVSGCYQDHGFVLVEQDSRGRALWHLAVDRVTLQAPEWLAVRVPAVATTATDA